MPQGKMVSVSEAAAPRATTRVRPGKMVESRSSMESGYTTAIRARFTAFIALVTLTLVARATVAHNTCQPEG